MDSRLVGLATQPRVLDQLSKDTRTLMRCFAPRLSAAQDQADYFRKCVICTPPPEVFTCVICGFASEHRWVYKMHVESQTRACMRTAERRARAWARKV